ncbi:B3 domain-containing protein [Canna indica]|uniref:B3 domain-containing protein n=1 Tax=Canna indica TaxID=4628 RepID=A0AAQ3Q208_9LILI|nr:B3 domain-containing protein [Canna indica]
MAKEEHRGARRPQFLKLLTPGCFLKLEIPRSFIKYLDKSEHRKATLFSPLMGNFWHMSIVKEGCNMYLSSGWGSFAQAHNLEAGRFVLFRYEGNMVFTVKLFLSDGCLAEHGANNISPRRILLQEPIDVEDSSLDDAAGSKPKSILSCGYIEKNIDVARTNIVKRTIKD